MSDSTFGFGFQADVLGTGFLFHLMTGKELKALSDAGIDFYTITVAIKLGKTFEVRHSLGNSVRTHVLSKRSIQSIWSKALSIGWGQTEIIDAMTKTKEGVNALLIVDAFSSGSTSYQAAQCFSALLSLRGCEADLLPNVDVLKHMINYFVPFIHDLGFSKVLGHITVTARRLITQTNCSNDTATIMLREKLISHLTTSGDASSTAGAVNQLMLTSQRKESCYMLTRMRGSWLSAFASHTLGMAVELRLNNTIIWESAGSNGAAIFELSEYQVDSFATRSVLHQKFTIVKAPNATKHPAIRHRVPIEALFSSIISQEPRIDSLLETSIRQGICRLVHLSSISARSISIASLDALKETANAFGFEDSFFNSADSIPNSVYSRMPGAVNQPKGLRALGMKTVAKLEHVCGMHAESFSYPGKCLCTYVNGLIVTFSVFIILLSQYRFDVNELYICEDILMSRTSQIDLSNPFIRGNLAMVLKLIDPNSEILSERRGASEIDCLGISGRSYTVCFTCILSHDCYDDQNRFLSLLPGRASLEGIYRSEISSNRPDFSNFISRPTVTTSLAPGFVLIPHHIPSAFNISMDMTLGEKEIFVAVQADCKDYHITIPLGIFLNPAMTTVRFCCSHDPKSEVRIEKGQQLAIAGFDACMAFPEVTPSGGSTTVIALHGNKLEQLLAIGILRARRYKILFQRTACLSCCIKNPSNSAFLQVIMGG
ncbi:uncharacterized protein F4812DRAFT_436166 [Daldinia caldariorum]|uniref:uncharacterized protein n=1 Tax=Daldinia caldariorum TaxID=326644 RepID=UPI002007C708|nr:uncharacterized protein F4812DRAFT_436166 [Daldinia caldariorum]KAI1466169.1 hypothetical protein F4812DRAFT_436166 [Daldinia caldariorum]